MGLLLSMDAKEQLHMFMGCGLKTTVAKHLMREVKLTPAVALKQWKLAIKVSQNTILEQRFQTWSMHILVIHKP